jgi:hypothetical protein
MSTRAHSGEPFDLVSYARRGSGRRDHFSLGQIGQIARTVNRTPEVMIKVLPKGANDLAAVRKHLDYIGRKGEVDLETDEGENLRGKGIGEGLLDDWDLELDEHRSRSDLIATPTRQPPRLVHKLMFSMPAGTPPDKVFAAVRNFLREEFALKHRYAMALHTDEPHPHVHILLKAVSEQGQRLHIRKATLREWRAGFAWHLRALGVAANATQRYVRGETALRKSDGIYRANARGESTHMRERIEAVVGELAKGDLRAEPGKTKLVDTRRGVQRGWRAVADILHREGQEELAAQVRRFTVQMEPPSTEKEQFAAALLKHARAPRALTR